jgi:hypothetical protein
MARASASGKMAPSGTTVHASNVGGTTTEPAAATATDASAAATSGERIIGDQGGKNDYDGSQNDESITKHGIPP